MINDITEKLYADIPEERIYHSTNFNGLMGIVESRSLWASDIRYMNDSAELKHTADLIRAEVTKKTLWKVEIQFLGGNLLLNGKGIQLGIIRGNLMIEIIDIGVENAVAYRVEGKITEEEMISILTLFKEKIEKGEKLIVYQEVVSIGGAELDAMIEKFKFIRDFGISHFGRIAVVTHKKWLHKIIDLEDKIFRNIDMKGFSFDEKKQAVEFLKNT